MTVVPGCTMGLGQRVRLPHVVGKGHPGRQWMIVKPFLGVEVATAMRIWAVRQS